MVSEQHFYADRDGPLRILLKQLRAADVRGKVARLFFERELQSPVPQGNLFSSIRFVAAITTIETAQWLIQVGATGLIQNLAGFVRGPVRELLRPHSAGVIDAQDENARNYAAEQEAEERKAQGRVQKLQDRLVTRTKPYEALNDFVELTEAHWPELPDPFKAWLSNEISALMAILDLEHRIRWEGEVLWTPREFPLILRIIGRYELPVVPDYLMVLPALGMNEQAAAKYFRRFSFCAAAGQTIERLLAASPSPRALEGLVRFVRESGYVSDAARATLRTIVTNLLQTSAVRADALQILAAQGEKNEFFIDLLKDPAPAIAQQAFIILVERQDRATIERELSRLLDDDATLKVGEVEIPYDSSLNWIGKIRQRECPELR